MGREFFVIDKSRTVTVLVIDRRTKKSKSFTVMGDLDAIYRKVRATFK